MTIHRLPQYKRRQAHIVHDRQKQSDRVVPQDELDFALGVARKNRSVHEAATVLGLQREGIRPNRKQIDGLYAAVLGEN